MAEGVGFEPTDPCGSPVFKTGALNRSAIPPESSNANNATGVRIGKLYSKIGKTRTESIGGLNLPSGTRRRSESSSMRSRTRAPVCRGFLGWDNGRGLSVCDRKNRLRNDEESKTTRKAAHARFIVADPRSACLAARFASTCQARGANSVNSLSKRGSLRSGSQSGESLKSP